MMAVTSQPETAMDVSENQSIRPNTTVVIQESETASTVGTPETQTNQSPLSSVMAFTPSSVAPSLHLTNQSETVTNTALEVLKWHGAELSFLMVMLVLAFFGNTLVIYIYHFRRRRSNFSFFIEALAGLDLINASVTIPLFLIFTLNDETPHFDPLCQGASFFAIATAIASGLILVIIAYDRNRKICKPLEREISLGKTRKLCGLAVFIGIPFAVMSVFIYGQKELEFEDDGLKVNITQCYFTDETEGTPLFWIFLVSLGLLFTGVVVTLGVLYKSIYSALKVHLARRESLGSNRSRSMSTVSVKTIKQSQFRSQKSSAKIFFAVTVAFFGSYFPFFIAVFVFLLGGQEHFLSPGLKSVVDIGKMAPFMSNAINPLIYSLSSKKFRQDVVAVFRCVRLRRSTSQRKTSLAAHGQTSSSQVDV